MWVLDYSLMDNGEKGISKKFIYQKKVIKI